MKNRTERGVALIVALILVLILSVMAVTLTFISQTETWSSMNYRLLTQARYGAESGLSQTANYLIYTYTPPGGTGDPLSGYNMTVKPVTAGGNPVILSANSNVSSNYPISSVQNTYKGIGTGTLVAGQTNVTYAASAKLLWMQQITPYGSTTPVTLQTWSITSDGNITGIRGAQVEVSAVLERQITPVFTYAAFATSNGCSALTFGGGGTTNSYDSSTVKNGTVTTQNIDGNVGTNGNLSTVGSPTTINGSLSTPRAGVGACSANNVTAWSANQGTVTGGIVELPQPVVYPNPTIPPPGAQNLSINKSYKCPSGANAIPGCSVSGSEVTIPPGSYGDISLTGGGNIHFSAGTYNINSLSEQGQSTVVIDSGPVILNVTGNSQATPIDLTGGGVSNPSLVPMNLQILYAGSGTVKLAGGAAASALIYAPSSSYSFKGGGDWYGAVIGQTLTDMGGAAIHYDRRLQNQGFTIGNWMLDSFTWKKY